MSQETCVRINELLEASVGFQDTPTSSDDEDWSDAESDKFEDLNDIFGSPVTDFSYEISSGESCKDESKLATKVCIFETNLN